MTQRQAMKVGLRLLAIYVIVEGAKMVGYSLSYIVQSAESRNADYGSIVRQFGIQALVQGGLAILIWVSAERVASLAAPADDGDDVPSPH
jgi:hypothetical protein